MRSANICYIYVRLTAGLLSSPLCLYCAAGILSGIIRAMQQLKSIAEVFLKNCLPYLVVFLMALYPSSDTDLGWHLKYGEYLVQNGRILRENIHSLEMTDYQWINSSWAIDGITYLIYNSWGFLGLTLAGAVTVTLILFFVGKAAGMTFWEKAVFFPLLTVIEEPLFQVSFRGQLLSLLFVSMLIYLLSRYNRIKDRRILWVIPLFILWSNLHGSFLLGIGIIFIYSLVALIKYKRPDKTLSLVGLAAAASSLINPFGWQIYAETWKHFGNPFQKYIIEWVPFPVFSEVWWTLVFWGLFLIANVWYLHRKKKLSSSWEILIISAVLFLLSSWMKRYAWTMYLVSAPLAVHLVKSIKPTDRVLKILLPSLILFFFYLSAIFSLPSKRLTAMNWQRYCSEYLFCSDESAEYLLGLNSREKRLTFYNWGGWLIWNYPDLKPSIDGRMHLWRDENNYSAFGKYFFLEQNVTDIDKSEYDLVFITVNKPLYLRLAALAESGKWQMLYKDERAGIFVRNK